MCVWLALGWKGAVLLGTWHRKGRKLYFLSRCGVSQLLQILYLGEIGYNNKILIIIYNDNNKALFVSRHFCMFSGAFNVLHLSRKLKDKLHFTLSDKKRKLYLSQRPACT